MSYNYYIFTLLNLKTQNDETLRHNYYDNLHRGVHLHPDCRTEGHFDDHSCSSDCVGYINDYHRFYCSTD